jgi:molecular chaperone DnaK
MKAGELAGFYECPLIQEPVAAALAYGFHADATTGYFLVYDFGGGTFDAAIMKAEEGSIHVVNHGGDNFLGGSNIDWEIIDKLLVPELKKNYNLPDFTRGNKKWKTAFAVIKRAAEAAKIQVSRSDSTYIEDCMFKDADGEEIELNFKLTRNDLINVAEPIIMRSVEICKRVLKEKDFTTSAIERILLVGGPTLAPYFRDILKDRLGIHMDYSMDPLTVVARGAAVFAGTQRIEGKAIPKAVDGQFNARLAYKNMGPDTDPRILGEVSSANGTSLNGYTVELANKTPEAKELLGWRSGKFPLKDDGKFKIYLEAEKGVRNIYEIELLDKAGRKQTIAPDTLVYTVTGAAGVISEQPIINSYSLALSNNETVEFFKKGDPLPAKCTRTFKTTLSLKKGESGNVLKVPVVEGNMSRADRNRLLGHLEVNGSHIRRDLPAGNEIEVTLEINSSRIINASAYIPMLDDEFKTIIDSNKGHTNANILRIDFNDVKNRIDTICQKMKDIDEDIPFDLLNSGEINNLDNLISAANGDTDAALKAEKELLELKIKIDNVEDMLKWPEIVATTNEALENLKNTVDNIGNASYKEQAAKMSDDAHKLIQQKLADPLRKKIEQIKDFNRDIRWESPAFHINLFYYLRKKLDEMSDLNAAERYFQNGLKCISHDDIDGLMDVNYKLLDLLPDNAGEEIKQDNHGYGSTLERV